MAYLNRTDHPVSLASGRVLAPGEIGEPDLDDAQDKALVNDGALLKLIDSSAPAKAAQSEKEKKA